jgi:hypothetical protein
MLTFNGMLIPGTHDNVSAPPPELQVVRSYFWGLRAESEIVGGQAGRPLSCFIWLHNQYTTRYILEAMIYQINTWVGSHGQLIERDLQNNAVLIFDNVTFEGFTRQGLGGRESDGPTFDYARTVDGGWFQPGRLQFRQLVSG